MAKRVRKPENGIYLHRGFFRQFLTRYPEVGVLYSRLMYTHVLVNQVRGDKYKKKAALNELWKGQTGAVYWHGRQGGAYANNLRKAAYCAFNEAEKITRNASMFMSSIIATDYDMDGQEEYLYQGRVLNAFVHCRGATLLELDYLPKGWNYLDTIARWPEHYHRYKYEGCDWYMRKGFVDHFFAPSTTLEKFDRMNYQEMGDFIERNFQIEELRREQRQVVLTCQGQVRVKRSYNPLTLSKSYSFKENGIDLVVAISNRGTQPVALWYGLEFNLSLAGPEEATMRTPGEEEEIPVGSEPVDLGIVGNVRVYDKANRVQITFASDSEFALWCLPVQTTSYLGDALQKVYQGSCLLPQWQLELEPDKQEELKVSLDLRKR
jgi:4-alpha-glucanotransferase